MNKPEISRPLIMGILNLTPDSFSDGGKFVLTENAINHALSMVNAGADIIDIGGESTRPGSNRVSADLQKQRIIETITRLRDLLPEEVSISVDTTLSEVAQTALEAGASIINDISAGNDDPELINLVASRQCPYIIMHMQGTPETMQDNPSYIDVINEIKTFLLNHAEAAESAGVKKENIIIDPGIGFGKTRDHNLEILNNLDQFTNTGYTVMLGTSRKRFMKSACKNASAQQLTSATCATTVIGVYAGVKIFRVHDVLENRQAADIAWEIKHHRNH